MSLIENLEWRYATKRMNGEIVPEEKVAYILEAARLAPTSSGLQPFKILVISDKELKEKISPVAFNQPQIKESSHLLVFAAWDDVSEARIRAVFAHTNKERGLDGSATEAYENTLIGMFAGQTPEQHVAWSAKQAYIAMGMAIAAGAEQRVDTTPMEGFNPAELDELLNLKEQGLRSVSILALGYRDTDNDWLVKLKKVRRPKEDFFSYYE